MNCLVSRFIACESGTAATKYGLVAGALAAAIMTSALGIAARLAAGAAP